MQRYHHALVEGGVGDYPFEQCWEDYRLATVLEPARLASAVAAPDFNLTQAHFGTCDFRATSLSSGPSLK